MTIHETYSKRLKRRERAAGQPEVYQYDNLPEPLRVQVVYILQDLFGHHPSHGSSFTTHSQES
jgi:hypothetical protein